MEGFEEAVQEHFGGETAGADEDLDDAGGCLGTWSGRGLVDYCNYWRGKGRTGGLKEPPEPHATSSDVRNFHQQTLAKRSR